MSGRVKFVTGDKVFAKVRGYPPWPARIEGTADETPNKMRYHVYFYGTGETAVVKGEDIWPFVETKMRFGKPKKHKNFSEALLQIEAELSDRELQLLSELEAKHRSQSAISNDSIDEDSTRKSTSGRTTPTPKSKFKDKKRKLDSENGTEPLDKNKSLNTSDSESSTRTSEVMSRSGRKIKPKRFADFEDEPTEENTPRNASRSPPRRDEVNYEHESEEDTIDNNSISVIVNNHKINIPLYLNKPKFNDNKLDSEWNEAVLEQANELKKRLVAGEHFNISPAEFMDEFTTELRKKMLRPCSTEAEEHRNYLLNIEARLLELDLSIRGALNIKCADTEKCIVFLDRLRDLNITALMLKKHPDVVQTIRKVRRYIGNVPRAYSELEEQQFHKNAEIIRSKAEHVYNKFQGLFVVPSTQSFWDFFEEEKVKFGQDTKHLKSEEVISLVEELP